MTRTSSGYRSFSWRSSSLSAWDSLLWNSQTEEPDLIELVGLLNKTRMILIYVAWLLGVLIRSHTIFARPAKLCNLLAERLLNDAQNRWLVLDVGFQLLSFGKFSLIQISIVYFFTYLFSTDIGARHLGELIQDTTNTEQRAATSFVFDTVSAIRHIFTEFLRLPEKKTADRQKRAENSVSFEIQNENLSTTYQWNIKLKPYLVERKQEDIGAVKLFYYILHYHSQLCSG